MKRVLQLPAYRRLLCALTLNELAWSISMVALSFLIYRRTGSAVGAAAYYLCSQFVPALFSPWVVARIDQLPARTVLGALYALEWLPYLALAWLAHRFSLAPVLILTTVDGILAVTARALARAATVSVTSAAGLLREGNALANTTFCTTFMAGPALGGAVAAAGGVSAALFASTGLFTLVAFMVATTVGLPRGASDRTSTSGRLRAALIHAKEHRMVRTLLSLQATALLFFTISMPVEVVYAQRSLHAGAAGYGVLLSVWGGGAVAGSTIYMRWRALPIRQLIAVGAGMLAAGFLIMAVAPVLAIAVVGAAVAGVGNGIEGVAARTALQEAVEEGWMARIMSLNESLAMFMPGAGIVVGGAITALTGPRIALATASVGALAVTALVWVVLNPIRRRGITHAEQSQREAPAPRGSPSSAAPPV